jgi:hypothetical protein
MNQQRASKNELLAPVFRFCFHTNPLPENTNIVYSVLQTIDGALQASFGVKVIDMEGGTLGYVTRRYTGCVQQVGGALQYDKDDNLIHNRGEMHIAKSILQNGDTLAVTLIHEAGHKYANLRDHGWRGYFSTDYAGYEQNTLPWQQCMVNADSYAVFVYLMANPSLARQRVPGLVRGAQRAANAAAGDEALEGVGNLFG